MTSPKLPHSITFVLGPPARPDQRAKFDRYEAERARPSEERDEKFCAFYEDLTKRYLSGLVAKGGPDGSPSLIERLFEAVLGVPIKIRTHFVGYGIWKGQHNHNLHFACSELLTPSGPLRALSADDVRRLAAAIGYVLKLDWVMSQTTWRDPEVAAT